MTRKTKENLEGIATAILLAMLVAYVLSLSGCATKHYGRQENLTQYEAVTLSCREIEEDRLEKLQTLHVQKCKA